MWKATVRMSWASINLENYCAQIGVDFSKAFNDPVELCKAPQDPYLDYRWVIIENRHIPFGVLHLVPLHVGDLPALWEEWFLDAGQHHHHVLKNHPHERATDIWQGEYSDTEHPQEVLGTRWHHSNDSDLRPLRYR